MSRGRQDENIFKYLLNLPLNIKIITADQLGILVASNKNVTMFRGKKRRSVNSFLYELWQ